MKPILFLVALLAAAQLPLNAQSAITVPASAPPSPSLTDNHSVELQQKLEAIASTLATTNQQLQQSRTNRREALGGLPLRHAPESNPDFTDRVAS